MLGTVPGVGGALHASRIMAVTAGSRPAWPRWRPAGLAWALWTLVMLGLPVVAGLKKQTRQAGRSDLGSNADTAIYGLVAVSAATVGMVLASRRPRHPVGLAAAGTWVVVQLRVCQLGAVGLAWGAARRRLHGQGHRRRGNGGLHRLRAAAHPDRVAAAATLAHHRQPREGSDPVG